MTSNICPDQPISQESTNENFDALELEKLFVHEVYDAIAPEFSSTRHSAWPGVVRFLSNQPMDAIGADIGCGNGKYLLAMSKLRMDQSGQKPDIGLPNSCFVPIVALERSTKLADIVRERGFDVTIGDIMQLPYRPGWFDFFLCIAVVHHLSTPSRRIKALEQLANLLRPGGQGLIQVWAKEQHDPDCCEPTTYIRRKNKTNPVASCNSTHQIQAVPGILLPIHVSGTEFPASDMLVPWKTKKSPKTPTVFPIHEQNQQDSPIRDRYYHLFAKGELDQLINQVTCFKIQQSYYEQGNWVVQVVKSMD